MSNAATVLIHHKFSVKYFVHGAVQFVDILLLICFNKWNLVEMQSYILNNI